MIYPISIILYRYKYRIEKIDWYPALKLSRLVCVLPGLIPEEKFARGSNNHTVHSIHMTFVVGFLYERVITDVTNVVTFPSVQPHMIGHRGL